MAWFDVLAAGGGGGGGAARARAAAARAFHDENAVRHHSSYGSTLTTDQSQ